MTCSKVKTSMTKNAYKFSAQPELHNPALIIGWDHDAGRISPTVIEYLNSRMNVESFCKIEPEQFFSLDGVAIERNIAVFPESRFFYSRNYNVVLFKSTEPQFEQHAFLNAVLDVAQHYCKARELFTVNATISSIAHTGSRVISAVFNQPTILNRFSGSQLKNMTWQGPPAISSYLLWLAGERGIPAISLWTEIPFYLAAVEDFLAVKETLRFLSETLNLDLNLKELDHQAGLQNQKIEHLRAKDAEIDNSIASLESGLELTEQQQMDLIKKVARTLEKPH